ncbi:hypothetical protein Bca4012_091768 [Brassica carinata]
MAGVTSLDRSAPRSSSEVYLHSPALDVMNQMLLVSSAEIIDVVFVVGTTFKSNNTWWSQNT